MDGENATSTRVDLAEDSKAFLVELKPPREDGGKDNYKKPVGYVRDRRVARLESLLELSVLC
jgi:hypothetical protein